MPHAPQPNPSQTGKVFLVGSGPGELELLTLRAARLLGSADTIVFDNLVGADILSLARPDAERVYVGKESGKHTMQQEDINRLLVRLAREGKQVVRLKGGDPFIFGRGGEEVEELHNAGIPFEVVPGITAACGAAAFSGIPLTHRDHAQACLFVTGHLKDGTCSLDWPALVRPRQTLVIYMGVLALPEISRQLIAHGMPPETPAACIRKATQPEQKTLIGTIGDLPQRVADAHLRPPALLIIGSVVAMREQMNWFERTAL